MSGLCDIVANVHAMPTFEGENYVLWQQCARYLDSSVRHFEAQGTMPDDLSYLANDYGKHHAETSNDAPKCTATGSDFLDADVQLFIYRHRACRLIFKTTTALATARSGVTEAEAWNRHMMASIDAARAHTEYQVLLAIRAQMDAIPPEYKGIMPVLTRVMSLYALSSIINPYSTAAITWAEDGYLSLSQLDDIRAVVDALLGELYYDALALTDAFDFTDASLASAIGCYDGNCYERMMEWVKQVPINVEAAKTGGVYQSGWKKYIEPFVRGIKAKL